MVDWEKPIQENDLGLSAEVIGEFRFKNKLYKVVLIDNEHFWHIDAETGRNINALPGEPPNIINVPETVERWVNVYEDEDNFVEYRTKEKANQRADIDRIGLVKLTIVDGKLERSDVVKDNG